MVGWGSLSPFPSRWPRQQSSGQQGRVAALGAPFLGVSRRVSFRLMRRGSMRMLDWCAAREATGGLCAAIGASSGARCAVSATHTTTGQHCCAVCVWTRRATLCGAEPCHCMPDAPSARAPQSSRARGCLPRSRRCHHRRDRTPPPATALSPCRGLSRATAGCIARKARLVSSIAPHPRTQPKPATPVRDTQQHMHRTHPG